MGNTNQNLEMVDSHITLQEPVSTQWNLMMWLSKLDVSDVNLIWDVCELIGGMYGKELHIIFVYKDTMSSQYGPIVLWFNHLRYKDFSQKGHKLNVIFKCLVWPLINSF
jgi:hypothetical protein